MPAILSRQSDLRRHQAQPSLSAIGLAPSPRSMRQAFRMHTYLRAALHCPDSAAIILTDLSGTGALVYAQDFPTPGPGLLDLHLPSDFVEEQARRQLKHRSVNRRRQSRPRLYLVEQIFAQTCEEIRSAFRAIEVQPLKKPQTGPSTTPSLSRFSLAFSQPHEGCYRLVRYLERQAIRAGQPTPDSALAA
jgi:hypothetical protein